MGNVPLHVESQDFRGFLRLGRTGRVRNEPMFGVAAKETECAYEASARAFYRYLRNRANR
jgi:hypothetical protein